MAIKRYTGTFRTRTDVMDNITPNNVVVTPTTGIAVPAGEFKPAAWLPVVWQGEASKDYFVLSSGKVVSFDATGRICPSAYKVIAADAGAVSSVLLTYAAVDVTAGTEDIRTGAALAAAGDVTVADAATAILSRGLLSERSLTFAGSDFDATVLGDCQAVLAAFFSDPIGVCAYDVYHWAGDQFDEERGLNFNNYQKQHLVQFFTQVQMQAPIGGVDSHTGLDFASATAWVPSTPSHGAEFPAPTLAVAPNGLSVTAAQLAGLARYSDSSRPSLLVEASDTVMAIALPTDDAGGALATNTERTPFEDANGILLNEKKSVQALRAAGDFFIDADYGLVILYGTTVSGTTDVTYYWYDADGASSSWKGISAIGEFLPGDYVTYDAKSNFVPGTSADHIGRVLAVHRQPRGLLERVNTAWSGSSFDATAQMPGSATKGFTDLITLSEEIVADKVLILNVNCA
jgi:hypothetical protein